MTRDNLETIRCGAMDAPEAGFAGGDSFSTLEAGSRTIYPSTVTPLDTWPREKGKSGGKNPKEAQ